MADASSKMTSATNTLHSNTFWLDCLLSSPSEGLFVEIIESIMFLTQINSELRFYYYPARTLAALKDVLEHFMMPASAIIPDWDTFNEAVYKAGIYGPRQYARDVVRVVFKNLGVESRKALEAGLQRSRLVPTNEGEVQQTADLPQVIGPV